jgi:alpha-L-fucosidase
VGRDLRVETIKAAGARYVIFNAKHHDGYLTWPSQFPNPKREGWQSKRDLVGELAEAVRKHGMEFGIYYSGGLDWTFGEAPIVGGLDIFAHVPADLEYSHYVVSHYRELIERYSPSVLWNDIGFPEAPELFPLLYFYVTHVPEGAINDRFSLVAPWFQWLKQGPVRTVANVVGRLRGNGTQNVLSPPQSAIASFRTSEDSPFPKKQTKKWEFMRGLGSSHAWNRAETDADLISAEQLVHMLADVTSKNGNFLLDIGADENGALRIGDGALHTLGAWMQQNGEAIYGALPGGLAPRKTTDGLRCDSRRNRRALRHLAGDAAKEASPSRTCRD